jgi:hypothetical protein
MRKQIQIHIEGLKAVDLKGRQSGGALTGNLQPSAPEASRARSGSHGSLTGTDNTYTVCGILMCASSVFRI